MIELKKFISLFKEKSKQVNWSVKTCLNDDYVI